MTIADFPKLSLERPLVFFDLETTGTDTAHDRIVEIAMVKVMPDGSKETLSSRINPEMHIPESSTAVHHISDADVATCPTFTDFAKRVAGFIEGCDLAGYNCNRFDIPMLSEEFYRAGVPVDLHSRKVIDVQVIYHKREARTLSAAHVFYCGEPFDGAHGALADTEATYNVLRGQLAKYPDLPNDVAALDKYTTQRRVVDFSGRFIYNEQGQVVFNFGKYKGRLLSDVLTTEPGYYTWMMKSDFPEDTKNQLRKFKKELGLHHGTH
jgi:DNA polymerase-3 subunit epsilon